MMNDTHSDEETFEVEFTRDQLKFVGDLVDEALSSSDSDTQDKALQLQEKLPDEAFERW